MAPRAEFWLVALMVAGCTGRSLLGPPERQVPACWPNCTSPGDADAAWVPPEPDPTAWLAFFQSQGLLLSFTDLSEWETTAEPVNLNGIDGDAFPRGSFGVQRVAGNLYLTEIRNMRSLWFLSGVEELSRDGGFTGPELVSLHGLEELRRLGIGADFGIANTNGGSVAVDGALTNVEVVPWGANLSLHRLTGSVSMPRLGDPAVAACFDVGSIGIEYQALDLLELGTTALGPDFWAFGPAAELRVAAGTTLCSLGLLDTGLTNLSPLLGATRIDRLSVSDTALVNISAIGEATFPAQVSQMSLSAPAVTDLSAFSTAPFAANLLSLALTGTNATDLAPLSGLGAVTLLILSGMPVTDLTPLAGHAALVELDLDGLDLDQADIDALGTMPALLTLGGNLRWNDRGIDDLSGLAGIQTIARDEVFDLSGNALTSLAGMESVLFLGTEVDLRGNAGLTDVDGLSALRSLNNGRLYLPENLTDISGLAALEGHSTANVTTVVLPVPSQITVRAASTSALCTGIDNGSLVIENGAKADVCVP